MRQRGRESKSLHGDDMRQRGKVRVYMEMT